MRRLPLLLSLAALPLVATADAPPRAKMEMKLKEYNIPMRDYTFPSGLRVIFQSDSSQPLVSITSVYDRGNTSDPEGLEGIAHVCEHMWFRSRQLGEDGKPLPKVWDLLREAGANLNASTADDWTNYMTVAPVEQLESLLRLESLRMRSAWEGITNEVLLTEREVVRNELRMRYENAAGAALGFTMTKLFPPTHPYGRVAYAGIGSHDSLNAITLPDIKKFFQDNYRPENVTIVVVGDFKLDDTAKFLEAFPIEQLVDPAHPTDEIKLIEPKPRISGPSDVPPPPPSPVLVKGDLKGLTTEHGAVEKPTIVLGWSLPGAYRDDQAMMNMAVNQMGNTIIGELDLDNSGCFMWESKIHSKAFCFLEIGDEKDAPEITEKALDSLYQIWSTDEMYRKIQNYIYDYSRFAQMGFVFQSVDLIASIGSGRAADTANYVHYTGDPRYYSRQFEMLNKVEAHQARKLAETYLNRNRAVAVLMLPYEDGDISMDTSDAQYRGARREDVLDTVMTEAQLTPELIAAATKIPDLSKLSSATLPSGVNVVSMQHSNAPLVQVRLVFGGGSASSPEGKFDFASVMWTDTNVDPTTGQRLPDPLRIVAFDDVAMGGLNTTFEISASAGNLEDAVYILRDRIDNIIPDTNGKLDWVKARKKALLTGMKYPEFWVDQLTNDNLAPNHPLSAWLDHTELSAMNGWSTAVTTEVFSKVLRPGNATLYVVGNVSFEETKKAADTYFGTWAGWGKAPTDTEVLRSYPPLPAPSGRKVYVLDKENSSQTNVTYQCQLTKVDDRNVAAAQILGDAISESTWLALREQTGASYGAYASSVNYRGGPAFLNMGGLVQNDAAGLAAKTFLDLGQWAKDGKIPSKTLAVVKYNRAQGYIAGQQSTEQMANRLTNIFNLGWTTDFIKGYPQQLANVTNAQLVPLLETCVGHEVVTLVGPAAVISGHLEKAGVKYEVFDWKKAKLDYAAKHDLKDVLKAEEKRIKDEAKKKAKEGK
jgi:zinc protease